MIPGHHVYHPYNEHSVWGGALVVAAKALVDQCESAATAETERLPTEILRLVDSLRLAYRCLEGAFIRGYSAYDIETAMSVKEELDQQEERLQNHLPGRYVVENDSCPQRYEWGARALVTMQEIHERARELLVHEGGDPTRNHLKVVRVEMCWHIRELCETGAEVLAEAWKQRRSGAAGYAR